MKALCCTLGCSRADSTCNCNYFDKYVESNTIVFKFGKKLEETIYGSLNLNFEAREVNFQKILISENPKKALHWSTLVLRYVIQFVIAKSIYYLLNPEVLESM